MIRVQIGTYDHELKDVNESDVNKQINGRRDDGIPVCAQVTFNTDSLKMTLSTPGCSGGGGGRPPTPQEAAIIELWNKLHLNTDSFSGGNLIAFLKQVQSFI